MSVYFYCTIWIFAQNPEDLSSLNDEQIFKLSGLNISDTDEPWQIEEKKHSAGQIVSKEPLTKIEAGGSRGYYFNILKLSRLYPKLLLLESSGADCDDACQISFINNGKRLLTYRSESSLLPNGLPLKDLVLNNYADVKKTFNQLMLEEPRIDALFNDGWIQAQDAFISGPDV